MFYPEGSGAVFAESTSVQLNSPDQLVRRETGVGESEMPGGGDGVAAKWSKMAATPHEWAGATDCPSDGCAAPMAPGGTPTGWGTQGPVHRDPGRAAGDCNFLDVPLECWSWIFFKGLMHSYSTGLEITCL